LCKKYECSKTHLALSYILSYPEVSTIIPGIRTAKQAADNTTGLFQLSSEDRLLIENLGETEFGKLMELIKQQG
jgi:aryl-alcohol dehydrogenase-like predicted oxidoreductase